MVRRGLTLLASLVAAQAWSAGFSPTPAEGQYEAPPVMPAAEVRARVAAAEALLTRADAQGALAAYDALERQLYESDQGEVTHSFACRQGVARLRAAPLDEAMVAVVKEFGTGLAVQTTDAGRATCASAAGLALADAATRAAQGIAAGAPTAATRERLAVIDDARFRAAVWLKRARTLHDAPALRSAFEALPPSTLADLARLSAGPPTEAADEALLARDLARARYAADVTVMVDCALDPSGTTRGGGFIDCYATTLPEAGEMGSEYPHTLEYFVRVPHAVRYAGGATHMPGYDCEDGAVRETRSWSVLTAARDHLDGILHVYRDGGEADDYVDLNTTADVCSVAQRKCVTYRIGLRHCEAGDSDGALVCTQSWEAAAAVRRGTLTFRRLRGTFPTELSSSILASPIDLSTFGAPAVTANVTLPTAAPLATPQTPAGTGACHAEVADPRPPLNVRAEAIATSAIAGTLPNGTRVVPRGRQHGWTRVEAPIAGWIWARNLRRVCD